MKLNVNSLDDYIYLCLEHIKKFWATNYSGCTAAALVSASFHPIVSTDVYDNSNNKWYSSESIVLKTCLEKYNSIPKDSILISTNFGLTDFLSPMLLKDYPINKVYTGHIGDSMFSILPWLSIKSTTNSALASVCSTLEQVFIKNKEEFYTSLSEVKTGINILEILNEHD